MGDAVVAYEEKPREQWLFDYPAQVSLCGTQIWWTTEVNIAFSRLEEVIFMFLLMTSNSTRRKMLSLLHFYKIL